MTTVNIHKAKTELSRLIARVERGEEIVISRHNVPVARLVPADSNRPKRREPGLLAHLATDLPEDLFLEPIREDELENWENAALIPAEK